MPGHESSSPCTCTIMIKTKTLSKPNTRMASSTVPRSGLCRSRLVPTCVPPLVKATCQLTLSLGPCLGARTAWPKPWPTLWQALLSLYTECQEGQCVAWTCTPHCFPPTPAEHSPLISEQASTPSLLTRALPLKKGQKKAPSREG